MDQAQEYTVALITENLHRRRPGEDGSPLPDPMEDPESAREWLKRALVEEGLVAALMAEDESVIQDTIETLTSFAATAVEMWAMHSGHSAEALVQRIAANWAEEGE